MYQECMMNPSDDAGTDEVCKRLCVADHHVIHPGSALEAVPRQSRQETRAARILALFPINGEKLECVSRRHGVALDS
jgi:hypothetical protein